MVTLLAFLPPQHRHHSWQIPSTHHCRFLRQDSRMADILKFLCLPFGLRNADRQDLWWFIFLFCLLEWHFGLFQHTSPACLTTASPSTSRSVFLPTPRLNTLVTLSPAPDLLLSTSTSPPSLLRVFAEWHFFAQNLCYFTQLFFLRTLGHHLRLKRNNFWAIFRIIFHHMQQDSRIFAQNYLSNLCKNQNYAKWFALFSQKTRSLLEN